MEPQVKERLQGLIAFIENMEAIVLNPYAAGLKTDQVLKDIKEYVKDLIEEQSKVLESIPVEEKNTGEKASK